MRVPSANRGLKSSGSGIAIEPNEGALAIVDFLTFSAPLVRLMTGSGAFGARIRDEASKGCETSIETLCRYVLDALAGESALYVEPVVRGFRNFYTNHMRIMSPGGKNVGFVALGGESQKGGFCVELTGEGCAHVMAWAHVIRVLESWSAKLTRVDCAHDDRAGKYTLDDVQRWHDAGLFTSRGRPPAIGYAGFDDGSGQTIYIGKNTGNQQLCVYEKGKQLGDPDSPWLRFEARFGSKYREIPYDILDRPWEYITGHYPCLSWIAQLSTRMQTACAKASASMASSIRHAKRQCGALVNAISTVFDTPAEFSRAVSYLLKRPKLPAWLESNAMGVSVLAPILRPEFAPFIN